MRARAWIRAAGVLGAGLLAAGLVAAGAAGGPADSGNEDEQPTLVHATSPILARAMEGDVAVHALGRTDEVSLQLVRIRTEVRAHIHERHTESITILEGQGVFLLGETEYPAGPGDVFLVPAGTVQPLFRTTGELPAAAVTTFTPGFDGRDRVFLDTR